MQHYLIRLEDGSSIGPYDEITIDEMRQGGKISAEAQLVPVEDSKAVYLNRYLQQKMERGATWGAITQEEKQELGRHLKLLHERREKWSDLDAENFGLIVSIPGRKECFEEIRALEQEAHQYEILARLKAINGHVDSMTQLLHTLTHQLKALLYSSDQIARISAAPRYGYSSGTITPLEEDSQ
jgi:hypothetical protein